MIPNILRLSAFVATVATAWGQLVAQEKTPRSTALSPAKSLASIELDAGFEIKVVAHEPQVIDPVDAAFDDQGRLWVVEMRDYPYPTSDSPSGCIRILSDEDLDGQFEKSVVFADRLDMPTGLAIWKDGAVITLAGQVVWFRDTDGDSKSDTQQVWIEGFAKENEQLRANHPRLGPDGWWYIASGLRGGDVIAGPDFRKPDDQPIKLGSRDVRFNPHSKKLEAITGPAQFGLCFDTIGNRIFCSNRNPAVMVRFEQEDLVGNPLAGLIPSVVDLIPAGEQSKVYPLVNAWTTSNLHSGQFTAACGVFYHEFASELIGARDNNAQHAVRLFTCEPTGSLVHSTAFGDSLVGSQQNGQPQNSQPRDWLASRDEWFRPVNISESLDGGILVVDMHRAVIEHPAWVPDELKKRPDERWGNDCGRIFHVARKGSNGIASILKNLRLSPLHSRDSAQLLKLLTSNNSWLRETARRLLIEREPENLFEGLKYIAMDQTVEPASRIISLQLAATLAGDSSPHIDKVMELIRSLVTIQDQNESVQLAAFKVGSRSFSNDRSLADLAIKAVTDSSPNHLTEYLRWIGASKTTIPNDKTGQLVAVLQNHLTKLAATNGALFSELLTVAASALKDHPELLLKALLNSAANHAIQTENDELSAVAAGRLAIAVVDTHPESVAEVFDQSMQSLASATPNAKRTALAVLTEFATRRGKLPALETKLKSDELWDRIATLANDENTDAEVRVRAIAILAKSPRGADVKMLSQFASQSSQLLLKKAGLRALASTSDTACDDFLLAELPRSSPQLQQVILDLIGQKPERLATLAEQLASGNITAKRIGSNELKKLVTRSKGETQTKLNAALESIVNSDRAKVVNGYQSSLTMTADALRGKEVFVKHCASCHKVADVGIQVGPDISDSRTQLPTQILTNILDPNRAIDNNYFRFVALTADDQVIEGMIAEETSDSIVLRGQNNVRTTLKRSDLQELKATGISLMPEGLESQIDQQAMADLISFIKNWRYLDGSIPSPTIP